ncbi:MAG: PEP-CTERM sorting domain-containing protein, partial [Deltaproteobacteria bacterium]|nr:PEP-CTERM sorting domain-containing protein [Deltaproteobacteria bacterium]
YAKGDAFMINGNTGNWDRLTGYYDLSQPGSDFGFRTYVAAVPEPETYAMLLAGLSLMGGIARRRKLAA